MVWQAVVGRDREGLVGMRNNREGRAGWEGEKRAGGHSKSYWW